MLAEELRRLRERSLLTGEEVSRRLGWSASKISRIENARIGVSLVDVAALLDVYGASAEERQGVLALVASEPAQTWWRAFSARSEAFLQFLDFEAVSHTIEQWELRAIPGLLQTADYARCIISAWKEIDTSLRDRQVDDRVDVRMRRQERLTSDDPLQLIAVIDEAVLRRTVGGASIMQAQGRKLIEASELPNVNLRVLPLTAPSGIVDAHFTILTRLLAGVEQSVLYTEHSGILDQVTADEKSLYWFRRIFSRLLDSALSPSASRDRIARIMTE
ncbi:helix-turn-helix domain-containing protein [Nonomuraea rubra]|uniref:helix-turn-helix domain-containing protein n=1 Tax=Nonomuraea rubra TaxID=46180 RepID=UPI0031EF9DC7